MRSSTDIFDTRSISALSEAEAEALRRGLGLCTLPVVAFMNYEIDVGGTMPRVNRRKRGVLLLSTDRCHLPTERSES
jgi:hypothetical protein